MRVAVIALLVIAAGSFAEPAKADPYRWCAVYSGGGHGGGTNCYFVTLRQCQETVSGIGGFCRPNPFYTGRKVYGEDARGRDRFVR